MPLAASLSILGMFILRCLHPPAAAVAMIVVLGRVLHYRYAFFPVMVDSVLLILAGAAYSNLTGKRYPIDLVKNNCVYFRLVAAIEAMQSLIP